MRKLALLSVAAILSSAAIASAASVTVSPTNMNGWSFVSFDGSSTTAGSGAMVTGPAGQPLGNGSANLQTGAGSGDGAERLITHQFDGDLVSTITSLIYSTYTSANNDQQLPYLKLSVSTLGDGNIDDEFIFEPPYQQPSTGNSTLTDQNDPSPDVRLPLNQWERWTAEDSTNASTGGWWDDLGVATSPGGGETEVGRLGVQSLATLLATYPHATIDGGVSFTVGFASPDDNFNGNVDDFTIGINGNNTTFDFEPAAVTPVPLPAAAWSGLALLGGLGLVGGVKRLRHSVA